MLEKSGRDSMRWNRSIRGAALAAVIAFASGCGVNQIPTREETAKAAWGQVENQYQRRADLVPNLVETVKGFARQEREVLQSVTEARARATHIALPPEMLSDPEAVARYQAAQGELSVALGRLIAISENYPELKSNQNFLALQAQLEGTENRIAVARRDYVEAVRAYNTEIRTFPGVIWKAILYRDAKPMATFAADEGSQEAPEVKFDP
jgi:LemA protein